LQNETWEKADRVTSQIDAEQKHGLPEMACCKRHTKLYGSGASE
jgi:hypothetical protein